MSLANTPVIQVCYDDANRAKVKVTAWYNGGGTTSNTLIQSNTLFGANLSQACILEILQIEGNVDLTNNTELLHLQYVSSVNQNTDIMVIGGPGNAVFLDGYIPNNANTPTGDLNIFLNGGKGGDCYSLMLTFQKSNMGQTPPSGNGAAIGVGSWANGFINI